MAEEHLPIALANAHTSVAERHVPTPIVHRTARAGAEEVYQELLLAIHAVLPTMCPEAAELWIGTEAGQQIIGATPFQWTVLGLRLSFLFAESFRS
jgi:hypothetical protein